ncbi:DNA alkylation repair protein [soil metagenome]
MPRFELTAEAVEKALTAESSAERVHLFQRFFKTGPGQYGEGDRFLGVTNVPTQRVIAKRFADLPLNEVELLLQSPWHECRLTALFILNLRMKQKDVQEAVVELYLRNLDYVNNWDLVDSSAGEILGLWLESRDRGVLQELAHSGHLWRERVAIVATFKFIRKDDIADTLKLAKQYLTHSHDLIHKATGWMLREAFKRKPQDIRDFLDTYAATMPRTMLRYTIELMDGTERKHYLGSPH